VPKGRTVGRPADEFAARLRRLSPALASLHDAGWACQAGNYEQASTLAEEAVQLARVQGAGDVIPLAESLLAACRGFALRKERVGVQCAFCDQPFTAPSGGIGGAFACDVCVTIGHTRIAALRLAGELLRTPPVRASQTICSFCGVSPQALGATTNDGRIGFCEQCFLVVGGTGAGSYE